MTHLELENEIANLFRSSGINNPSLEARLLMKEVVELRAQDKAKAWAAQRLRGVPLAYLTLRKGFFKSVFKVCPGVLIPRPESEHVLEVALARSPEGVQNIADLGSGSGCLGISLLLEWPSAQLTAIEVSSVACAVIEENVKAFKVADRVKIVQKDLNQLVPLSQEFDLVVANPPYIAENDPSVQPEVHTFEPHLALYSGHDGLVAIRIWAHWAYQSLKTGGLWVCEIGTSQSAEVMELMNQMGYLKIQVQKDLAGHDRVVSAFK